MKLLSNFADKILLIISVLCQISAQSTQPPFSCDESNPLTISFPFCNANLDINKRVQDLIPRLTLDEKISQLVNTAPAIPRLGISAYQWWSESLHGISRHGKGIRFNGTLTAATAFPQVILTTASFDPHLWYRVSQAIGKEARAFYNEGQAMGMTFWAPNINIYRDPRWGRGQETPGEDPLVAGTYAVSYVRGLEGYSFQGQLMSKFLQASACCKHYTAHDLDNWNGVNRYIFNAQVNKQDLADTFQPPFKSCIQEGRASGLMCAYNRINGVPACADYDLLEKTIRGEWAFEGYVASDCDAVAIIYEQQKYAKVPEDAVADVLKAGMDVNCGSFLLKYTESALEQKKLNESDIDRALHDLFSVRMRLGMFNGDPRKLEYGNINSKQVCTQEHLDLALEAARDGIVLLKNSDSLLPLSKMNTKTLAIIGATANNSEVFAGNYEGLPCKNITILQALQSYLEKPVYQQGCDSVNCTSVAMDGAVAVAKEADYVLLVMGLDQTQEREKHDRTQLVLPGEQENLIRNVSKAAKKPVVLVLLCGGPVDISFAKDDPKIGSILWAGYPGEAGGIAVAQVIFGDHNPGGRLPVTWYPNEFINFPMTDMRMRPDPSSGYPGRTYRFYTGKSVFPFGYGLSYTTYSHDILHVSENELRLNANAGPDHCISVSELGEKLCSSKALSASVQVKNVGQRAGKHPVLLFVRPALPSPGSPKEQLVGFQSVKLEAGEKAIIEFVVNPCKHLSKANKDGDLVIEQGTYFLTVEDKEHLFTLVFSN